METGENICTNCGEVKPVQVSVGPITAARGDASAAMDSYSRIGKNTQNYRINRIEKYMIAKRKNDVVMETFARVVMEKLTLTNPVEDRVWQFIARSRKFKWCEGRTINAIVGASIYAACREMSFPRTIKEIAAAVPVRASVLFKIFTELFGTSIKVALNPTDEVPSRIFKYATELHLSMAVAKKALELNKYILSSTTEIEGKKPSAYAICLLMVVNERIGDTQFTQRQARDVGMVSEVTIRYRVNDIKRLSVGFNWDDTRPHAVNGIQRPPNVGLPEEMLERIPEIQTAR